MAFVRSTQAKVLEAASVRRGGRVIWEQRIPRVGMASAIAVVTRDGVAALRVLIDYGDGRGCEWLAPVGRTMEDALSEVA